MEVIARNTEFKVIIIFSASVVSHFMSHRQIERNYEVGGQLFAKFLPTGEVLIEKVTGPRASDSRWRYFFKPSKRTEQKEINTLFKSGFHYVGDWHTHPEDIPSPSAKDENNIGNIFLKSKHSLNYFILVIVGQNEAPGGLYVGIHNGTTIMPCDIFIA